MSFPRLFNVTIEPSGGGPALFTTNIVTAPLETSRTDRTPVRGNALDLTQFVGQDVRISFDAELPDYFGSGLFQLDNVALRPRLQSVFISAGGVLHLFVPEVAKGQTIVLQASNDLQAWTDVLTRPGPSASVEFIDSVVHDGQRFYRAVLH